MTVDGDPADSVRFYQQSGGALTLMQGGNTVYGVTISEDGKTLSLNYIYSGETVFQLISVSFREPAIVPIVNPALPLGCNGDNGTLTFPEVVDISAVSDRLKVYGSYSYGAEQLLEKREGSQINYVAPETGIILITLNRVQSDVVPFVLANEPSWQIKRIEMEAE